MNKKQILIVSGMRQPNGLSKWMERPGPYELTLIHNDETAIELAHQQFFDLALIDTGDANIGLAKLEAVLPMLIDDLMIQHYNGQSPAELNELLAQRFAQRRADRVQRYLVLDSSVNGFWDDLPPFSAN